MSSIYWGVWQDASSGNGDTVTPGLDTALGKRPSVEVLVKPWYSGGYVTFSAISGALATARGNGQIVLLNWMTTSWSGTPPAALDNATIASGAHDAGFLNGFADGIGSLKYPIMILIDEEMNGPWNAWYDSTGTVWISMFRHVVDVFRARGAVNATFVWCANQLSPGGSFSKWWVGANYADKAAVDCFNVSYSKGVAWMNMDQMLSGDGSYSGDSWTALKNLDPTRKTGLWLGSIGSENRDQFGAHNAAARATLIETGFSQDLPHFGTTTHDYSDLEGVLWFNQNEANSTLVSVLPGNTHSSTTIDNLPTTGTLSAGISVSGSGIPAGATVASVVSPTAVTISAAATSSLTATPITFGDQLEHWDVRADPESQNAFRGWKGPGSSTHYISGGEFLLPSGMQKLPSYAGSHQLSRFTNAIRSTAPRHLVLYPKFNETTGTTAGDSSGNARNGTYTGGFTLNQAKIIPGVLDPAVLFNGSTGYATFPDNDAYSLVKTGELTIIVGFTLLALPAAGTHATLVSKAHPDGLNYEHSFWISSGGVLEGIHHALLGANYCTAASAGGAISVGTTYLGIMTYKQSRASLGQPIGRLGFAAKGATAMTFVDSDDTPANAPGNGTGPLEYGRRADGTNYGNVIIQHGPILDIAISDQSMDEIRQAFNTRRQTPMVHMG